MGNKSHWFSFGIYVGISGNNVNDTLEWMFPEQNNETKTIGEVQGKIL
jgi:hypothetical protein